MTDPRVAPDSCSGATKNSGAVTAGLFAQERVAQLAEKTVRSGSEPAFGAFLASKHRKLTQDVLLLRGEPGRRLDAGVDQQVAASDAPQVGDAHPLEGDDVTWLGAGPDREVSRPVEGLELDGGTQGSCGHRELDRAVEVIPSTLERLMGGDDDLDIQVTGWPCTRSDLTLARELDPGAGVDPARDPELEVAA